jgi:mRNA-degrading endonuclease RelE of RelBE toxin-antitoxin system
MPQIEYRPRVFKQLSKIPKVEAKKIIRKLETLAYDPYSGKQLQGEYKNLLSIKAWPYRIIYLIKKDGILIYSIKHRQGSYK